MTSPSTHPKVEQNTWLARLEDCKKGAALSGVVLGADWMGSPFVSVSREIAALGPRSEIDRWDPNQGN